MSIQFYLKVSIYIFFMNNNNNKVFCKFDLKDIIFQNFSLDKGICLTFIKKRKNKDFFCYISLSKNKI